MTRIVPSTTTSEVYVVPVPTFRAPSSAVVLVTFVPEITLAPVTSPVTLPVTLPTNSDACIALLAIHLSSEESYVKVALAPATVRPAPSACEAFAALPASVRLTSSISTEVELIVVVVPLTSRLPRM